MTKILPDDVVDAYDGALIAVLAGADNGSAGLHDHEAAVFVEDAVVGRHHLAFLQHWNRT